MTKSNKPQVKIVNCETGEEIVRDANAEEIAQMELDAANAAATKAEADAKEAAKAAILDRIGLTADELKTILG
jgi:predicted flap endonuclease-1-like 5' DNA nuclease